MSIWVKFSWRDILSRSVLFFVSLTLHFSNMVHCREPIFSHVAWIHLREQGNVLFGNLILDGGPI